MWIIHFLSMTTHSLLRTVLHCSQCHHWQHLDCHHLLLFDYVVWDRWVSGLQPLIGFALPWPRWSPPHQQTHPYLLSQPYFFSHTSLYLLYVVFLVAHSKKSCKVVKYPDQISMCLTEQLVATMSKLSFLKFCCAIQSHTFDRNMKKRCTVPHCIAGRIS